MTPVEELFQLLWDTPQDKFTWFSIRKRMLEKEKEVIMDAHFYGQRLHAKSVTNTMMEDNADGYYNETFNTEEK